MKNQDMVWFAVAIVVLVVLIALGIRKQIRLQHARHNWPMGEGKVESTDIHMESRGGQPGAARHVATVSYSYSVQGHYYSGQLKRQYMLFGRAEKWLANFPNGTSLVVRYNPAKPADSVLFENEQCVTQAIRTA